MSAHAVTRDADPAAVKLIECREECLGQFLGDIRIHVVSLRPRFLCSIDVETGTGTEIVGVILALYL